MDNEQITEHFLALDNQDVIDDVLAILSAFIDERSYSDRQTIKSGLSTGGVDISATVCHRDGDPD